MNIGELAKFPGSISVDTVNELTSASGVTIDGILLKDATVTASGASGIITNTITERSAGSGVTIDGVLLKDNAVTSSALTANHALYAGTGGLISSEQYLAKTRGGTGITSTATFPASGTIAVLGTAQTFTANQTFSGASGVVTNVITERSAGSGVTIDGVLLKDGGVAASGTITTDNTTEATNLTDGSLQTDGGLSVAKQAVMKGLALASQGWSPAASGSTDAYDTNGFSTIIIASPSSASHTLNGIDSTGFATGKIIHFVVQGVGASSIIIANEAGSAATEDRITTGTGGNVTITADGAFSVIFMGTRWWLLSYIS